MPKPLIENGNAPPLMRASAGGNGILDLNLHVDDLGHSLIFGATGSGKSVLLAMIAAQFRRYQNARIYCIDKGQSLRTLTLAVGGDWIEVSGESEQGFSQFESLAPMSDPLKPADQIWITEWIDQIYARNNATNKNRPLSNSQHNEVIEAVKILAKPNANRTPSVSAA